MKSQYFLDRTGSVRILARDGIVANRYAYDPFGELFDSDTEEIDDSNARYARFST